MTADEFIAVIRGALDQGDGPFEDLAARLIAMRETLRTRRRERGDLRVALEFGARTFELIAGYDGTGLEPPAALAKAAAKRLREVLEQRF